MSEVTVKNTYQNFSQIDPRISTYKTTSIPGLADVLYCPDPGLAYVGNRDASIMVDRDYVSQEVDFSSAPIRNKFQINLTNRYARTVLNFGVGTGDFVKMFPGRAYGYDMNRSAVRWLSSQNSYIDPLDQIPDAIDAICVWNSLSHLTSPCDLLTLPRIGTYAILSLPMIADFSRLGSHSAFKPGETYYYFSKPGLVAYMYEIGYDMIEAVAGDDGLTYFSFLMTSKKTRNRSDLVPVATQSKPEEKATEKRNTTLKKSDVKVSQGKPIPQLG